MWPLPLPLRRSMRAKVRNGDFHWCSSCESLHQEAAAEGKAWYAGDVYLESYEEGEEAEDIAEEYDSYDADDLEVKVVVRCQYCGEIDGEDGAKVIAYTTVYRCDECGDLYPDKEEAGECCL